MTYKRRIWQNRENGWCEDMKKVRRLFCLRHQKRRLSPGGNATEDQVREKGRGSLRFGNRRSSVTLQAASVQLWGVEARQPSSSRPVHLYPPFLPEAWLGKPERKERQLGGHVTSKEFCLYNYIFKCATEYLTLEVEHLPCGLPK